MSVCPYCGATVDDEPWCENTHMTNLHPSIVIERLRAAGEHDKADELEQADRLAIGGDE